MNVWFFVIFTMLLAKRNNYCIGNIGNRRNANLTHVGWLSDFVLGIGRFIIQEIVLSLYETNISSIAKRWCRPVNKRRFHSKLTALNFLWGDTALFTITSCKATPNVSHPVIHCAAARCPMELWWGDNAPFDESFWSDRKQRRRTLSPGRGVTRPSRGSEKQERAEVERDEVQRSGGHNNI